MIPDDNWKETQVYAQDLSTLLGIDSKSTQEFLVTLENVIIHRLVEVIADTPDKSNKDYSLELPYLGNLIVSLSGTRDKVSVNFVTRPAFYRKIRKACHDLRSPLVGQVSSELGKHLVKLLEEGED